MPLCPLSHRHAIACILPPYILRNICEHGSAEQRRVALRMLSLDTTLRALRASNPATGPMQASSRRPSPAAGVLRKQRTIYDGDHQETLPGRVVRTEGQPVTGEVAVDEAYDGLGATFDLFADAYDRNSIDDEGRPLVATAHYGRNYDNAFWNGEQMVFGDGDGQTFNRFTRSLDVIGHELTHGVTEDEAHLNYLYQPGALNESISDVFG